MPTMARRRAVSIADLLERLVSIEVPREISVRSRLVLNWLADCLRSEKAVHDLALEVVDLDGRRIDRVLVITK